MTSPPPAEEMAFEPLQVAIRAWTTRAGQRRRRPRSTPKAAQGRKRHPPQRTIVFDTETSIDPSQRLHFGVWRYFIDAHDELPGTTCVREGILYADELPERDREGFAVLQAYVAANRAAVAPGRSTTIQLVSRSEFVEQVIYELAYKRQATIVGFNLPFDLSRIAIAASTSRRRRSRSTGTWSPFYRGNSLRLFQAERARPRIAYKAIDSKRALIGFTNPDSDVRGTRGNFLDLRTHVFALTNAATTLERACGLFGVPYTKREVDHGAITPEYVDYCREDVQATTALLGATVAEHRRHPIAVTPPRALSPASIGKSYLDAMGIVPILTRQPAFQPLLLGTGMESYFGGRAECRVRKVPLPVVYVDFLSMYPTVNSLMGIWELVTAREVAARPVTDEVRGLLQEPDLAARCFDPELWRRFVCLVEVIPDGDVVPVRARYDRSGQSWNIGVNPYRAERPAWYSLPDLVNSVIQTGRVPQIVQAVRYVRAHGRQPGMRSVALRGEADVDPRRTDFFRSVIEMRALLKRGTALEGFLKVLANSTSYGIFAEMTRIDEPDDVEVVVQRSRHGSYRTATDSPEDPGDYCFPPVAAVITGAARLMLGLLEHEVKRAGGSYVFCDTDSMAIVADEKGSLHLCPGGGSILDNGNEEVRALTTRRVDRIVRRFSELNPYDREVVPGSILKVEDENFVGRRRVPLWCYAISAKRYVLYRTREDDISVAKEGHDFTPSLEKFSEHGLGHLVNPLDPEDESDDWMAEIWRSLLHQELGLALREPEWLNRPALTRVTVSGPTILHWFEPYNEGRSYADQMKPGNFFLIAHPDPLVDSGLLPFAPFERDPSKWMDLQWLDRHTGDPIRITTDIPDGVVRRGVVKVRTYRDVLAQYALHPELKSLAPVTSMTQGRARGLLRRRPVELLTLHRVGKEGNKIEERMEGVTVDDEDYLNEYLDPDQTVWKTLVVPVLDTMNKSEIERGTGINRGTVTRYVTKGVTPHPDHETTLTELAARHARWFLANPGIEAPSDEVALFRYLRLHSNTI